MNLVIVESPTKSKTIKKYLGKNYQVTASMGHIRDLPVKELGIDVKKNFEPEYVIPEKAEKTLKELKRLAKKSDLIILATDEDREGEAIAWHLLHILKPPKYQRIAFHEITKRAIEKAKQKEKADQLIQKYFKSYGDDNVLANEFNLNLRAELYNSGRVIMYG